MFIGRHWRAGAALVLSATWGGTAQAELVSARVDNEVVQGAWLLNATDEILLEGDQFTLDWDEDGRDDVFFQHRYVAAADPLIADAVPYIVEAIDGLYAIRSLLDRMSANAALLTRTGVDQQVRIREATSNFQAALDAIELVTTETQVNHQRLLDGTSGLVASSNSPDYVARHIPAGTAPGSYSLVVTEPAQRARVYAATAQTAALAADEILSINGVSISLSAGSSVDDVVDRVNLFSAETGVVANATDRLQTLQLSTTRAGKQSQIDAVASMAASAASSGIGTAVRIDAGEDAAGSLGGAEMVGAGAMLLVTNGVLDGVAIELVFDEDRDRVTTASGTLSDLTIVDQSLQFVAPSGKSRTITFPDVRPSSLGISVNSDLRLDTATLVSFDDTKQAQERVQRSISQVEDEILRLSSIGIGIPAGENLIEGSSHVRFVQSSTGGLLDVGDWVGLDKQPNDSIVSLSLSDAGYLGVALELDDGTHYGWIKLGVGRDLGLVVHDAIWETTPNQAVRVGVVPEPCGVSLIAGALAWMWVFARNRTANARSLTIATTPPLR